MSGSRKAEPVSLLTHKAGFAPLFVLSPASFSGDSFDPFGS